MICFQAQDRWSNKNTIIFIRMKSFVCIALILSLAFAKTHMIFQITDIHVEPDYRKGAPTVCENKPCCRKDSVPTNGTYPAPIYGDHHCDNSPEFFVDSLYYLREFFESHPNLKPDYIITTGDEATHRKYTTQTPELNVELVRYVYTHLKDVFGDYKIIPSFGNHDTYPEGKMALPPENQWMTDVMVDLWKSWIPEDQIENVRYGGYYTMEIEPGLRAVVMNCLWYYNGNPDVEPLEDAAKQKAFVEKWLEHAKQNDEKVWLISHISPGMDIFEQYKVWFSTIFAKYEDVIRASFYGHTHVDQFYITRDLADEKRRPTHVDFVCAAFEGLGGNNPAIRLYQYDDETKEIVDYTVYIAKLEEMAISGKLEWKEYYQARKQFGVEDFKPTTMLKWAEKMWEDEDAFQEYMRTYHMDVYKKGDCVGKCKVENMCALLYITKEDRQKCMDEHPY